MDTLKTPEPTISRADLCRRYGITSKTAAAWDAVGHGPKAIKIGPRTTVYRVADVAAFDRATELVA